MLLETTDGIDAIEAVSRRPTAIGLGFAHGNPRR
jgi:hypothetical protein